MSSDQFISEIRIFGGDFAPEGWFLCDGSEYAPNVYVPLFQLIGTIYGGDGITSFAVPDLRVRIPIHPSGTYPYNRGRPYGEKSVTLATKHLPAHTHHLQGAIGRTGSLADPIDAAFDNTDHLNMYDVSAEHLESMSASVIAAVGGSEAHENRSPYLVLNYIIAYEGVYPQRSD